MSAPNSDWSEYRPSQFSLIQVDAQGELSEIRSGQRIPGAGEFSIELDDGTRIERNATDADTFRLLVPHSRGFEVTRYRVGQAGVEWSIGEAGDESLAAGTAGTKPQRWGRAQIGQVPLPLFEKLVSALFFAVLLWHLLVVDRAIRRDESFAPPEVDQSMDTSDEYIPDSDRPLPVRTEG